MELERVDSCGAGKGNQDICPNVCLDDCCRCSFFGDRLCPGLELLRSRVPAQCPDVPWWLAGSRTETP